MGNSRSACLTKQFVVWSNWQLALITESKVNLSAFAGAAFSLNGDTHMYGDGEQNFDFVNVGITASKTLKFSDLNIPVSATTMWNPATKIARVQLAVALF